MLRFIVFALEEGEAGYSSFGQTVVVGAIAIGIWYAIGKWRQGK